ncbi:heterokaryon incompatibility protein-domain-containing protein, partial [Echria macrotheca]
MQRKCDNMSSSQLPEYTYTPLAHEFIRMVTLHPGAPDGPLRISINTRYLPFCPPYTAVSYVWGSSERPHLIDAADTVMVRLELSDGTTKTMAVLADQPTGTLRITENLRNLLLNIRPGPEEKRIHIWVDSICINQEDDKEKTAQVKLMAKIFAHAENTIFYLGAEDEISRTAFKTIKILNMMKDWPADKIPESLRDVAHLKGPNDAPNIEFLPGSPDLWRPFILLLTRPWFSRTWIIQEVVLTETGIVTCGRTTLTWDELVTACQVVNRSRIHQLDPNRSMVGLVLGLEKRRGIFRTMISLAKQGKHQELGQFEKDPETLNQWHILSVIKHARNYHATDPRDKIFALVEISGVPSNLGLDVDYSIPLDALYTKVAKAFIYHNPQKPLSFLSLVDQSYYTEDLPSYIADWRRPRRSIPITAFPFRGASRWTGIKNVSFHFLDTKPEPGNPYSLPRGLLVAGCRVLTIKAVEDVKPHGVAEWHALSHASLINAFPEPYPTTHLSYKEAFARSINPQAPRDFQLDKHPRQETLWEYRAGFPHRLRDRPVFQEDIAQFRAAGQANIVRVWDDESEGYIDLVKNSGAERGETEPRYTQQLLYRRLGFNFAFSAPFPQEKLVMGRQWFISEDGFMGLVPQLARKGDVVVHFFGGDPLFVLRKEQVERVDGEGVEEGEKERWGFLGEAFVLGLMDGEVEFDLDADKVESFLLE